MPAAMLARDATGLANAGAWLGAVGHGLIIDHVYDMLDDSRPAAVARERREASPGTIRRHHHGGGWPGGGACGVVLMIA